MMRISLLVFVLLIFGIASVPAQGPGFPGDSALRRNLIGKITHQSGKGYCNYIVRAVRGDGDLHVSNPICILCRTTRGRCARKLTVTTGGNVEYDLEMIKPDCNECMQGSHPQNVYAYIEPMLKASN